MKNYEIYQAVQDLAQILNDENVQWPVKTGFYLQKNLKILATLSEEIETMRISIAQKYGTLDEENNNYNIPSELIDAANEELSELFMIEQEVELYKLTLDDFADIKLSAKQLQVLMFMVEE